MPEGNCKKCGFPTCMAFALKLVKGQSEIGLCPYVESELKEIFEKGMKKPQKEVWLGRKNRILVGGENVLHRHDKTFVNKTAIAVVLDVSKSDWEEKLKRIIDFEITRINDIFKVDLIYLKGLDSLPQGFESISDGENPVIAGLDKLGFAWIVEDDLKELREVRDEGIAKTVESLSFIRKKAVLDKDENFSSPVYLYFKGEQDQLELMSKASFYLCKYANMLIFEEFDEALFSTLMTLRQNIYTDPQKPLQVESKVYDFNNADENSLIFLTTNFALTYFAVANEIEAIGKPAYLVVTPSDGMSVLTAWSAEKFTAQIAAKTIRQYELEKKVKNKQIIIPGLLSHMKSEIEEALPEFEILIGPNEAYLLGDFVKNLS